MAMLKEEGLKLERLIIDNLIKYFEKPVTRSLKSNESAIINAVSRYFGKEKISRNGGATNG